MKGAREASLRWDRVTLGRNQGRMTVGRGQQGTDYVLGISPACPGGQDDITGVWSPGDDARLCHGAELALGGTAGTGAS